ncbi:predicted protein [Histoplasma capsulatum H143]|uniref:Uncharacterized protein n=1 Tax=Ajellomyces capsulatus (strain H143) TaxID=544712 RepID=C6HAR5_AJECH|nr:predicted protein [Histoplasma capsulatum H143]
MFVFPSGGMFRLKIDRSPRIIRSNSMLLFPHFIETGLTKATSLHSPLSGPGSQLVSSCLEEWPSRVWHNSPVAGSQSLTVLSLEPDASSRPSGEKATDLIQS